MRKDLAAYYDEIQRFDSDLGQVLDILEKRGLAKNTIVVFMGDNGSAQFRGKGTLFELGIRVPLIIRWPGTITPGSIAKISFQEKTSHRPSSRQPDFPRQKT